MNLHVGLDISQRKTAICVVNDKGKMIAEGNALTLPSDIHGWLVNQDIDLTAIQGVCLEAGAMSSFIYKGLEAVGLPVVCSDDIGCAADLVRPRDCLPSRRCLRPISPPGFRRFHRSARALRPSRRCA